jgi:hypothetical protein
MGFGVTKLGTFNQALLGKGLWRYGGGRKLSMEMGCVTIVWIRLGSMNDSCKKHI